MDGDRTPSLNPYLRRPWTRGRIGGRTRQGAMVLVGVILVYLLLFGESGWISQLRLESRKNALEQEVQALETQADLLSAEATRLETEPAYRLKIAREEWGHIEEGETVFQLRYED